MPGNPSDRRINIEAMVIYECESYFQKTQHEIATALKVKQPTVSDYKRDPYYQECITKYKSGKIGESQLKSATLIDRVIQLGHESIPMLDKAVELIGDAETKSERESAFSIFKSVIRAFQDGCDKAKWLLEKTDPAYATKIEDVTDYGAPADDRALHDQIARNVDEKLATATALVPHTTQPPEPGNGKGNGNGRDPQ